MSALLLAPPSTVPFLCLSSQPVEGSNDFLQLLKSHKEKLEEGMRELRKRNEELEREKEEGEKERDRMRRSMDQLRAKLAQAQVMLEGLIAELCTQAAFEL